jgi:hypothetical protein
MLKRLSAVIAAMMIMGCGNVPEAHRTPDGFDPPYNYY